MVKSRGVLNKNAMSQFSDSISGSGILRAREVSPSNFIFDVNAPVVQMQKRAAFVSGVGRIVVLKGNSYIPSYTFALGTSVGSGYVAPSDGIYAVSANVAVSGVAIENYCGSVYINSVAVSGTSSFASSDARGAANVNINGIVHVPAGATINVGVKSIHGNITTIGVEDLVHACAANMTVVKLPSDSLTSSGS